MKKVIVAFLFALLAINSQAQKFAFVDTDYILKSIPTYESAQDQLGIMSKDWQSEIETKHANVEKL